MEINFDAGWFTNYVDTRGGGGRGSPKNLTEAVGGRGDAGKSDVGSCTAYIGSFYTLKGVVPQ